MKPVVISTFDTEGLSESNESQMGLSTDDLAHLLFVN